MGSHLSNFLATSWKLVTDSLSTSTLSLVVFSIGVPLIIFGIVTVSKWSKTERTWASFARTIREDLKFVAILSIVVEAFAWICLFSWGVYKSVYNDHQNLSGRLLAVVREKDELKKDLKVRDQYIQRLKDDAPRARPTSGSVPVATVINAAGGIPIVGNQGTVDHPTVNNYAPIPRTLLDETKKNLIQCLHKKAGKFSIGAVTNHNEAYKYAEIWRSLFLSAGWEIEHKDTPIQNFIIGNGTWTGIRFKVHNESSIEGQTNIVVGTPEKNAIECLMKENGHIAGGGTVLPFNDFPTGSLGIEVGEEVVPQNP